MKIDVEPGKYVVAVSGGVDSMVMLDLLKQQPGLELTVAHFDHGVRQDSAEDRRLVQEAARRYGLPFMHKEGNLGPDVSEAAARKARYDFLQDVQRQTGAAAIITAHHQDDVLETALINMLRGTGRKGLSSLQSRPGVLRPLLDYAKDDLLIYARQNGIVWHEDSTNQTKDYLRNQVRRILTPKLDRNKRAELFSYIKQSAILNAEIDELLDELMSIQPGPNELNRYFFVQLPHKTACEFMAYWLRGKGLEFDRRTIERLVIFCKTAKAGKLADAGRGNSLGIGPGRIFFQEEHL